MDKSFVRRLAFTLVLVLVFKTFVSDYNSIGVRAESVPETATVSESAQGQDAEEAEGDAAVTAPAEADVTETIEPADAAEPQGGSEEQGALPEEEQAPGQTEEVADQPEEVPAVSVNEVPVANDEAPADEAVIPEGQTPDASVAGESDGAGQEDGAENTEYRGRLVVALYTGEEVPNEPSIADYSSGKYTFFDDFGQSEGIEVNLNDYIKDFNPDDVKIVGSENVDGKLTQAFKDWAALQIPLEETQYVEWYVIKLQDDDAAWHIDGIIKTKEAPEDPVITEPEDPATETPVVSEGNAEFSVQYYLRSYGGEYEDEPTQIMLGSSPYNKNGMPTVGKSFTIEALKVLNDGGILYNFDKASTDNVVVKDDKVYITLDNIEEDKDGSKNVFKLYYDQDASTAGFVKVAYYILLPEIDMPDNSDTQADGNYYPEKVEDYSYERWTGLANTDLYDIPADQRDSNGNLFDPTGKKIKEMIKTAPEDQINEDLQSTEPLKSTPDRCLSDYRIPTGSDTRAATYNDIVWYVYKNVGEKKNLYHIDGYIKGAYVDVTYHSNYPGGDEDIIYTPFRTGQTYTLARDYVFEHTRKGWTFTGWNTEPDGTGKFYSKEDCESGNAKESLQGSLHLYAQWTPDLPDDKIKLKIAIKANADGSGRDTYIKYNGVPHRGDMDVEVTVDHEVVKNALSPLFSSLNNAAKDTLSALSDAVSLKASAETGLVALNENAPEEEKIFRVPDKEVKVKLSDDVEVSIVVKDLTVTGGYGKHVLSNGEGYPITLNTENAKVFIEGIPQEYTEKFEIVIDTGMNPLGDSVEEDVPVTSAVIGNLYILPREVELVSATAEKVYDGDPLMAPYITVGKDGFATGDSAEYTNFASQTNVGSTPNTFSYNLVNVVEPLDYKITQKVGTLTVKDKTKGKVPDKKKKKNKDKDKKENNKKNDNPRNDSPSNESNNQSPTVLGAIRPMNGTDNVQEASVLGSRRGATEDTTNTARLFVLIGAAAAVAILLLVGKKRKDEDRQSS